MNIRWLLKTVVTSPASASAPMSARASWPRMRGTGHQTEQFAGDLTGAVGGPQDFDRIAVDAPAELGHLVSRARAKILGDRADPGVADGRHEVSPVDELATAGLGDVALERTAAIGELGGNLGRREISQQGGRRAGP